MFRHSENALPEPKHGASVVKRACLPLLVVSMFLFSGTISAQDPLPKPPVLEKQKVEPAKQDPAQKADPKKEDSKQVVEEKKEKSVAEQISEVASSAKKAEEVASDGVARGDIAWMLVSTALVMLMVPGLALFYGGMVRRKNVLATMMQSMICLSVVGVFWIAIGYSLAFGDPLIKVGPFGILGFSPELVFLRGVNPWDNMPGLTIPVYLHMAYQGMFAIITPALISGALAERIKFKSFLLFILVWMVVIYCPLAQCVWAMNWNWGATLMTDPNAERLADAEKAAKEALEKTPGDAKLAVALQKATAEVEAAAKKLDERKAAFAQARIDAGKTAEEKEKLSVLWDEKNKGTKMSGLLGAWDALDFAGGTVVHISAGLSSLAAFLALRKRYGYPEHAFHPNSMVLTLTGAGLLWFGWFGFNGGSGLGSGKLAVSAFTATQAAAAAAGLSWTLVEWIHRGKPTALGFASGVVAGLVAVTPAAGYILPWAGLVIGLLAGVVCYGSVYMKSIFKYDDSLDAFGVHGVGGFFGAVITGFFCWKPINAAIANNGFFYATENRMDQVMIQLKAAVIAAVLSFVVSFILVKIVDALLGFTVSEDEETTGLDRNEHGETGFDLGLALEAVSVPVDLEPRAAIRPPNGVKHFTVMVDGASGEELSKVWSELCLPSGGASADFKAVYPNLTTFSGNRFKFRGGDANAVKDALKRLFESKLRKEVTAKVE
jgi:Amt family ammonium transporter